MIITSEADNNENRQDMQERPYKNTCWCAFTFYVFEFSNFRQCQQPHKKLAAGKLLSSATTIKALQPSYIKEMGAYKYLEELWRKKQSDVMRFLLRVR
ncbi:hypothetical protein EON65_04930 [archaeon]|nr:MAG: hypothetical protein EON65_04930 [archaeon]